MNLHSSSKKVKVKDYSFICFGKGSCVCFEKDKKKEDLFWVTLLSYRRTEGIRRDPLFPREMSRNSLTFPLAGAGSSGKSIHVPSGGKKGAGV